MRIMNIRKASGAILFLLAVILIPAFGCTEKKSVTEDPNLQKRTEQTDGAASGEKKPAPIRLEDPPDPSKTPRKNTAAPADMFAKRVSKHGTGATVRARGSIRGKAKTKLKLHTPDWKQPVPLTFRKLDKNYQYYRLHKEFFPQGLPVVHGGAVEIAGAVMPIDTPGPNGELKRFWLANPVVVMAGCVFCNPPTLADLVYVEVQGDPIQVDREELYRSVMMKRLLGRLFIGPEKTADGVEFVFKMALKRILE